MDNRDYEGNRAVEGSSALFRIPRGIRPIIWEKEDELLFLAHERARKAYEIRCSFLVFSLVFLMLILNCTVNFSDHMGRMLRLRKQI